MSQPNPASSLHPAPYLPDVQFWQIKIIICRTKASIHHLGSAASHNSTGETFPVTSHRWSGRSQPPNVSDELLSPQTIIQYTLTIYKRTKVRYWWRNFPKENKGKNCGIRCLIPLEHCWFWPFTENIFQEYKCIM